MNKLKSMLSSPARIALFAICVVAILALLAFAGIKVGASVMNNQGIGLEKATQVALQNAGYEEADATLIRGHFDRDDGLSVYEIEFRAGGYDYDYVISSKDGTIIEVDREYAGGLSNPDSSISQTGGADPQQTGQPDDGTSGQATPEDSAYIGVDKAKELALQNAGVDAAAATFTKAKLDQDDGVYVYEIEFVSGEYEYSYELSATDGTVVDKDVDSIYD